MLKSVLVLLTSFFGIFTVAAIKHVPFVQMIGVSALIANFFGVLMASYVVGIRRTKMAFLGTDLKAAKSIGIGLMFASVFGSIQGLIFK